MTALVAEGLELLGFNIDRDAGRLALATPTGGMPVSRQLVMRDHNTPNYITRIQNERWEEQLSLERFAYVMMYPHDVHLVLRDQLAERYWRRTKGTDGLWRVEFRVPKLKAYRAQTLDDLPNDADVQLGLDGSATLDVDAHRRLGFRQRDVLRHIAIWPSSSTEIGTFIHQQLQHGEGCGHYARDSKYASDYHGSGCCAEASSTGSRVARSLVDSLDLLKDTRRWKARDESW